MKGSRYDTLEIEQPAEGRDSCGDLATVAHGRYVLRELAAAGPIPYVVRCSNGHQSMAGAASVRSFP